MGIKRMQFRTSRDAKGNCLSLIIDMENRKFSWCNHWINLDFIKVSRKDIRRMRDQLVWFGYEEVL